MKMKLLPMLSVAAAIFCSTNLSAQRNIDWQVDAILIPPSEMRERPDMSGSDITISAVLKNAGPDTARVGDSIRYRIVIPLSQGQQILMPGPTTFNYFLRILDKDLAPNDTVTFITTGAVQLRPTDKSFNVNISVISILQNGGSADSVKVEENSTLGNNVLSEQITWFVRQGWGVNVKTVDTENTFSIYPNPSTTGIFQINTLISNANNAENTIKVYDYSGQVVYVAELNNNSTLDLSNLSNGIYFVTFNNGLGTETTKVSIAK